MSYAEVMRTLCMERSESAHRTQDASVGALTFSGRISQPQGFRRAVVLAHSTQNFSEWPQLIFKARASHIAAVLHTVGRRLDTVSCIEIATETSRLESISEL